MHSRVRFPAEIRAFVPSDSKCAQPDDRRSAECVIPSTAYRQDHIVATAGISSTCSLPMNIILSPNGQYALVSDMGFDQSLTAINASTGGFVSNIDYPNCNYCPYQTQTVFITASPSETTACCTPRRAAITPSMC